MLIRNRLPHYCQLMRLDKPIGLFLLLWPTLWALWLASDGHPEPKLLFIFITGVILMRSAGCIMNDYADQRLDAKVKRTKSRPLAAGKLHNAEALLLALLLAITAFTLVLVCNALTIKLSVMGLALAIVYPFLKRITYFPQGGLGLAFSWGVPMAFAATQGKVPPAGWLLFFTAALWPLIYDTLYAMADRADDIKIGIKSTAILFAKHDKKIIACLQIMFLLMLTIVGVRFHLQRAFYFSLLFVIAFFVYQQWLIKNRDETGCFNAFLNNNWVGLVIFIGIFLK